MIGFTNSQQSKDGGFRAFRDCEQMGMGKKLYCLAARRFLKGANGFADSGSGSWRMGIQARSKWENTPGHGIDAIIYRRNDR